MRVLFALSIASSAVAQQSPYQKQRYDEVAELARVASMAARPALLRALDEPDFRSALAACCGDVADASAEELRRVLVEETRALEIVTGIPAGGTWDESYVWATSFEEFGDAATSLDNEWANRARHNQSFQGNGWFQTQDNVETGWYGFKPFSQPAAPASLAEADERGNYFLLNSMRSDIGSPLYGNITLVVARAYARAGALFAAVDSGEWTALCNATRRAAAVASTRRSGAGPPSSQSAPRPPPRGDLRRGWPPAGYERDCTAVADVSLGTFADFEHLLLANLRYWNDTSLATALARSFELLLRPWQSPLRANELYRYMEVMPAMQTPFDSSVAFVIASFPDLFGTETGELVREWCAAWAKPLVWSLGLNVQQSMNFWNAGDLPGLFPSSSRVLDARLAGATTNATSPERGLAAFDEQWRLAADARARGDADNATWLGAWRDFAIATPGSLTLSPRLATSCTDLDRCFGLDAAGSCVCLSAAAAAAAAAAFPE